MVFWCLLALESVLPWKQKWSLMRFEEEDPNARITCGRENIVSGVAYHRGGCEIWLVITPMEQAS